MSIKPIARGVMICERVIVEEGTHNVSPINIFTRRLIASVPSPPQQFDVFALLTGGQGRVKMTVRISHGDTLSALLTRDNTIEFADKLREVRFIRRIENCVFPSPGRFQVELHADNQLIALSVFDVMLRE